MQVHRLLPALASGEHTVVLSGPSAQTIAFHAFPTSPVGLLTEVGIHHQVGDILSHLVCSCQSSVVHLLHTLQLSLQLLG